MARTRAWITVNVIIIYKKNCWQWGPSKTRFYHMVSRMVIRMVSRMVIHMVILRGGGPLTITIW